jgi:hypothetical protein
MLWSGLASIANPLVAIWGPGPAGTYSIAPIASVMPVAVTMAVIPVAVPIATIAAVVIAMVAVITAMVAMPMTR